MRGSPLFPAIAGALMLVGTTIGPIVAQSEGSAADAFPSGTFVADFWHADRYVEFAPDGSCRWVALDGYWERGCTYATNGDLFTEMTFDWPDGPQVPATYYWSWDGELLTLEPWGAELQPGRYGTYALHPLRHIEDGMVAYVANAPSAPGELVSATRRFLPSAELPADVVVDLAELRGRTAIVAVERGQPVTRAMLALPE